MQESPFQFNIKIRKHTKSFLLPCHRHIMASGNISGERTKKEVILNVCKKLRNLDYRFSNVKRYYNTMSDTYKASTGESIGDSYENLFYETFKTTFVTEDNCKKFYKEIMNGCTTACEVCPCNSQYPNNEDERISEERALLFLIHSKENLERFFPILKPYIYDIFELNYDVNISLKEKPYFPFPIKLFALSLVFIYDNKDICYDNAHIFMQNIDTFAKWLDDQSGRNKKMMANDFYTVSNQMLNKFMIEETDMTEAEYRKYITEKLGQDIYEELPFNDSEPQELYEISPTETTSITNDLSFLEENNYIVNNCYPEVFELSMDLSNNTALNVFENTILSEQYIIIEAVSDEEGNEALLFWSRRQKLAFYCYMDNNEVLEVLSPFLSRSSFTKICYQPYFLYSYCRKFDIPIKRVFSISSCHLLLYPDMAISTYKNTISKYLDNPWADSLHPLIGGMNYYAYVATKQKHMLCERNLLGAMDECIYYDEVLGRSFDLSSIYKNENMKNLFKLTGPNEFLYNTTDSLDTIPAGRFVEFEVKIDNLAIDQSYRIIRHVVTDMAEKGRFRKTKLTLLSARNNSLKLFIPEYNFNYMMTVLSSVFTTASRSLGVGKYNIITNVQKAISEEKVIPRKAIK